MIDLLEIGIENLISYDDTVNNDYALQLLSQPDLLEQLFDGLSIAPATYGVCGSGRCSNVGTMYNAADSQSGWIETHICASHARAGLMNGLVRRAQFITEGTDEMDAFYHIYQDNASLRTILMPRDCWPTVRPEQECGVCNEGILNDISIRGYAPVVAIDAHNNEHTVHMACSWECNRCDRRHISQRWRRDNSPVAWERIYVSLTSDLDGTTQVWCEPCVNEAKDNDSLDHSVCNMCGSLIFGLAGEPTEVYSELHGEWVCQGCYDNGVECDHCGCTMYNDDYHECDTWDDDDEEDGIHNYSYKPHPIFHGEKPPFMGFELEVEAGRHDRNAGVDTMCDLDPNEKHWYLKHDGSLSHGFEVVTHPHTIDQYQQVFNWSWLDKLTQHGFRSWNTSSCGLHVHIGLDAFNDENHQIRFTKFIYDNERQVKRIAGRSSNYAAFDAKGRVIPKIKRKWQDANRYSAVNVQNENTLEVRVFRGSLRKERVLSGIEFTHAVCEYTRNMKIVPKQKPFSWLRFSAFVAANDEKYPNLFIIMNETFERAREIDQQEDGDNN